MTAGNAHVLASHMKHNAIGSSYRMSSSIKTQTITNVLTRGHTYCFSSIFSVWHWTMIWLSWCFTTPHSTQNRSLRRRSPSQSLGLVWQKPKPRTTKACIHQSNKMYYNTKKHQKLKRGLVAFYDIWPGNGAGLFSKEKISIIYFVFILSYDRCAHTCSGLAEQSVSSH